MLNTLKFLVHRFRPKAGTTHAVSAQSNCTVPEESDKLISSRAQDMPELDEIRKRAYSELHMSDVTARQRERMLMDRWFNRGDQSNSGSFNIAELQRRMEETFSGETEDRAIEGLPAQEDLFMAFSKPEVDMFEEEKMSLSGVFLRVDLDEDVEIRSRASIQNRPFIPRPKQTVECEVTSSYGDAFDFGNSAELTMSDAPAFDTLLNEISFEDRAVEETLQELMASETVTPIFDLESSGSDGDRSVSKFDPSALFDDWDVNPFLDPLEAAPTRDLQSTEPSCFAADESSPGEIDFEANDVSEFLSPPASSESGSTSTSSSSPKPNVKLAAKPKDAYWYESGRLARFGRRRTSASCSSSKLRA